MRVGEKEVSERAEIVAALRRSLQPRAARRAALGRGAGRRRRARAALPAAQGVRGRASPTGSSPSARTSSRTRSSPSASRSRARRCRSGRPRRSSRSCPSTATARSSATSRPTHPPRSTRRGASSCATRTHSRPSSPASPIRSSATRRRRGSPCARSPSGCARRARTAPAPTPRFATAGSSALLGDEREEMPASYHMSYMRRLSPLESTYTKERSVEVCMDDALAARLRPRERDEHQARPRRPAAEVSARLRDRLGRAERRPPDHPGPGRAARLPGVPARGGSRAPLRRLRPAAPVHVPEPLARPRADRDLLVRPRGDLARARLARRALRPLRRGGAAKRRGDGLPRGAALPAVRGEARLRARVLGPLPARTAALRTGTPSGSARRPGSATGPMAYLADMDAGFYSADYLRAWIRSAQLREYLAQEVGAGVVALTGDRRAPARALQRGDAARRARRSPARIGFDPLDTEPLVSELGVGRSA